LARFVLADLAQGLVLASAGEVRFRGRDWAEADPSESSRRRGETGRVFAASSWISNLNIDENITLAARHHTGEPPAAVAAAAAELSSRFDLPPPPPVRPAAEAAERLRRYEWVRAFLGRPRLILLENPFSGVYSEHRGMFHSAVAGMLGDGAAAVWITDEPATLPEPGTLPSRSYRLEGTALVLQD
ncbi:MAG TPA: hypothetical protein PK636_04705, partial [bacterium]|nr:hypothetical protein [bacterium]